MRTWRVQLNNCGRNSPQGGLGNCALDMLVQGINGGHTFYLNGSGLLYLICRLIAVSVWKLWQKNKEV